MNAEWTAGDSYAITGPNGSGKSTLLQVLSGAAGTSEGTVRWLHEGRRLSVEQVYREVALVAPYLDLIEEMTATEFLEFHFRFKPQQPGTTVTDMLAFVGLAAAAHKQIRYYSSGMKQRVKLAQAFFAATPLLLLDEPCTNLDATGYALYHRLLEQYTAGRLVVVSSNDVQEYGFCKNVVDITAFKPQTTKR